VVAGSVRIGNVELVPLVDAVGELGELAELFPDTPDWAPYRDLYPELFVRSRWRLPCTCYLLRSSGDTVLVDTGVGPAGLWSWDAEFEEGLLPALADAGVAPPDIDVVFLTHLHVDHVGWNTDRDGRLVFPNARYIAHRDGVASARARPRGHVERAILPVAFEELDGESVVAEGVVAFPLPGHLAGHMGVRIESQGERAVLIADAAVNPMQLAEPERVYVFDADPALCAATRRALLPELVDQDVLVVCGHYPDGGVGRVVTRDGLTVWEAAVDSYAGVSLRRRR
jgi:glyoxylase-like metal-dependent hydrolase (beta-lactamase superfamily II)